MKKLREEQETQLDEIKEAKRQARGASAVKRKQAAKLLAEALAEQTLIDDEIGDIVTALPGLVEAEGRMAAEARIATLTHQAPAQVAKLMRAQKLELDAAGALIQLIEAAGAARLNLMRAQLEIRLLRSRWPQLAAPPVVQVPALQDVAPGILRVIRLTPIGPPKPLVVPRSASDGPEEVKHKTRQALAGWLEKHGRTLSKATREIFEMAGVPVDDSETPENRRRREEREVRAKEAETEFTQRASAEGARVYREGVLR